MVELFIVNECKLERIYLVSQVLRNHELLAHPFSVTVFENHIYWTDWHPNAVLRSALFIQGNRRS